MTRALSRPSPWYLALAYALTALAFLWTATRAKAATTSPTVSVAPSAPLHVMLDPGHGGSDTGASRGPLVESEIALKVAQLLATELKTDARFKVSMTRNSDRNVDLDKRTEMASEAKADIFVSIHLNSSTDTRAHGMEIWFQNQMPADEEALFLAGRENEVEGDGGDASAEKAEPLSTKADLKRILEDLHRNHRIETSSELGKTLLETLVNNGTAKKLGSRAIRQAPFRVVSHIEIPSVLVELGFLSNPTEGPRLAQIEYQKRLAKALFDGLVKFKETMDNDAAETLKSQSSVSPLNLK